MEESSDAAALEDDESWRLQKPELSFRLWKLWRAFDVPPFDGGLAAWPEWFVHDVQLLEWQNRLVRRDMGV